MTINRAVFFDGIRGSPLPKKLSAATVQGITAILDEWERRKLIDLRWLADMLATALGECGQNMLPVREGFKPTDASARAYVKGRHYAYAKVVNGNVYYGRGLVQLTWDYNYKKQAQKTGIDFYNKPDLALIPENAAKIMFNGMIDGDFTGKKLSTYFNSKTTDWINARRIINGTDRASEIGGYAKQFYSDLVLASKD